MRLMALLGPCSKEQRRRWATQFMTPRPKVACEQTDEADRGRHTGFARHEGLAGGPGSLSLSFLESRRRVRGGHAMPDPPDEAGYVDAGGVSGSRPRKPRQPEGARDDEDLARRISRADPGQRS